MLEEGTDLSGWRIETWYQLQTLIRGRGEHWTIGFFKEKEAIDQLSHGFWIGAYKVQVMTKDGITGYVLPNQTIERRDPEFLKQGTDQLMGLHRTSA